MIDINLLKYFDKSFSEIYKIENETEVSDKKALLKKFFIILSTNRNIYLPVLLFLLIIFVFSLYNLWTTMSTMDNKVQTKNKTNIVRKSPAVKKNIEKKEVIPVTIDNDSREMNDKEQKSVKTDAAKTVEQQTSAKKSGSSKNSIKADMPSSTIKPTKNKKEQQNTKSYVIIIKGLDKSRIDKIRKLSENYGVKISKTLHSETEKALWHVYIPDVHSDIQIGDIRVKKLTTFADKDNAVNFAEKREGKFFIKRESVIYKEYNVKIEGFENIKKAKLFAEDIK